MEKGFDMFGKTTKLSAQLYNLAIGLFFVFGETLMAYVQQ